MGDQTPELGTGQGTAPAVSDSQLSQSVPARPPQAALLGKHFPSV